MSEVDETGVQMMVIEHDLAYATAPGDKLSPFLVLLAYARGEFPFLHHRGSTLWWCPHPRAVMRPTDLHVSRSLRKVLRQQRYQVTADTAFVDVVRKCRSVGRGKNHQVNAGSWIDDEIEDVFSTLHSLGHAHSFETWEEDRLVGGLYGVSVGQLFVGCSMFRERRDASKVALVRLMEFLPTVGIPLVDCQLMNPHLKRLGAVLVPREQFREQAHRLARGTRTLGLWTDLVS